MTYHSILRTSERANLNQQSAIRMIERAKECGKKSEQFPADERNYMKRLETEEWNKRFNDRYLLLSTK